MSYGNLTGEQAEHFLERGFVTVRGAFDPADARQWLDNAWRQQARAIAEDGRLAAAERGYSGTV